ncbi:uncharacterized protein TRIREDRAFT_112131 [Trichoderma reesei QM6a]|uniref:Predicted protein n=1 Tax=Hypocrea jecorina (strain QM6a) TaxID=431241 RepID=G0RWA3_HYPJQ|nr:uncharacterized protein TRIREDRAFT_112131 [Trichoderma reesei QM6a]EGR44515.1 predicted protein [Trichoderma reesei QM6a]
MSTLPKESDTTTVQIHRPGRDGQPNHDVPTRQWRERRPQYAANRCFARVDETYETARESHVHAFPAVSNEDLDIALDILDSLPSPEAECILAKPHINPFDGWIPLETTWLLTELRSTFAAAFGCDGGRERFTELASIIFSNTAQRVPHTQVDSAEDWYTLLSGTSLRWETVGLLFSSWALAALQNKEDIDQYRPHILALRFLNIMESCIRFCRGNRAHNVLLVYLIYRTSIVSSILHGTGPCAIGLDTLPVTSIRSCCISKQSERRLFAAIYVLDKAASVSAGRPPLLASSRGTTALPLDISNTVLVHFEASQKPDVDLLRIDDQGWNTDGEMYATTSLRARGLIAHIREELLAIALNKRQNLLLELA